MSDLMRFTRSGEQEFASIHRRRSGIDSGEIDFGWAPYWCEDNLSPSDKQQLLNTTFALYQSMCKRFDGKAMADD